VNNYDIDAIDAKNFGVNSIFRVPNVRVATICRSRMKPAILQYYDSTALLVVKLVTLFCNTKKVVKVNFNFQSLPIVYSKLYFSNILPLVVVVS
jgi:hypothetical protein